MNRIIQTIWDFLGVPFRLVLFDQKWLPRFGWTTLEDERIRAVLPQVKGRLLDIGAGENKLVRTYKSGIGVDIHDWGGGVIVVDDTSKLPFENESFDTITFIACINHIPYREAVIREANRLLKPKGRLIITMINPILGNLGHTIWWYGEDRHRGGMKEGEVGGMWSDEIISLCNSGGFKLSKKKKFVYTLNNLYVFEK